MTSEQIQLFLSVAKHRNFTKAAAENHISQPTASRQIAQLEAAWGVKLFHRNQNVVQLTAAGEALAKQLAEMTRQFNALLSVVSASESAITGSLAIGFLSYLNADIFVYPLITEFTKRYPNIKVKMDRAPFPMLSSGLDAGAYDILFAHNNDLYFAEVEEGTLNHMNCYPLSHLFVLPSFHPLASKEDLQLSDLSGETFLLQESPWRQNRESLLRSICKQAGIEDIQLREAHNMESILSNVRAGLGAALVLSDNPCLYDSRYFCIPAPETESKHHMCAMWSMKNTNPITPLFMQLTEKQVALIK